MSGFNGTVGIGRHVVWASVMEGRAAEPLNLNMGRCDAACMKMRFAGLIFACSLKHIASLNNMSIPVVLCNSY